MTRTGTRSADAQAVARGGIDRGRRRSLLAAAGLVLGTRAHGSEAPVGATASRLHAPELMLTGADGRRATLPDRLRGHKTAVQLMFTGCSSTCPPQGLLFSTLAARPRTKAMQWLSISIDALGDDPARLAAWLGRHGTQSAWQAAVPAVNDVAPLVRYLRGIDARADLHTTQVFLFDAAGRLAWRTGDLPRPAEIEALLAAI